MTPADFSELKEIIESFGLRPVMIPDLSALDGSRQGVSALALGGATVGDLSEVPAAECTIAVGASMERPAAKLRELFGIEYRLFDDLCCFDSIGWFLETLALISGRPEPARFRRQRRILVDAVRDAHFLTAGRQVCLALEPDHALAMSAALSEAGGEVVRVVIPQPAVAAARIAAREVVVGGFSAVGEGFGLLVSSSHATGVAERLKVPLYQVGFPCNKVLGGAARVTVGYRGVMNTINEVGNLLTGAH
jgi:nitrogenase molybdenum-iron protein alpha/beta subunit